jgi:hypothetical protein
MAGSIALSLTQRYDKTSHEPLDGGLLYFYAAGTTTPQSAYQDISLAIPWPNPITLDSGGNVPQLFFADGYVKFRLANADGVTQIEADFVLVLGPTAGVGAAPSVDATTILATGDIKVRYGTGVLTGFVRANGRTIGSASSGASEYANAAAQTLFEYLWTEDANLTVSTGRGASAAADWAANKTIALPDTRGRDLRGLADMGSTSTTLLDSVVFNSPRTKTDIGATGGASVRTIVTANLPPYTPSGTVSQPTANVSGNSAISAFSGSVQSNTSPGSGLAFYSNTQQGAITITQPTFTGEAQGGTSTAMETISPTILVTIYIKL